MLWDLKNKDSQVILYWIPSHIDIQGNEIVDGLAKRKAESDSDVSVKSIFRNNLICKFKKKIMEKFSEWIKEQVILKRYFRCKKQREARNLGLRKERIY